MQMQIIFVQIEIAAQQLIRQMTGPNKNIYFVARIAGVFVSFVGNRDLYEIYENFVWSAK